jgi:hypothetical protein
MVLSLQFVKWICPIIESSLSGENLRASTAMGYPQGGEFLPLPWSLVVDDLLWKLSDNSWYTITY